MKRIHKIALEIQNIASEHGHVTRLPESIKFTGRSSTDRGERVMVTCDDCFSVAYGTTKPHSGQPDIEGRLLKNYCEAVPDKC